MAEIISPVLEGHIHLVACLQGAYDRRRLYIPWNCSRLLFRILVNLSELKRSCKVTGVCIARVSITMESTHLSKYLITCKYVIQKDNLKKNMVGATLSNAQTQLISARRLLAAMLGAHQSSLHRAEETAMLGAHWSAST